MHLTFIKLISENCYVRFAEFFVSKSIKMCDNFGKLCNFAPQLRCHLPANFKIIPDACTKMQGLPKSVATFTAICHNDWPTGVTQGTLGMNQTFAKSPQAEFQRPHVRHSGSHGDGRQTYCCHPSLGAKCLRGTALHLWLQSISASISFHSCRPKFNTSKGNWYKLGTTIVI